VCIFRSFRHFFMRCGIEKDSRKCVQTQPSLISLPFVPFRISFPEAFSIPDFCNKTGLFLFLSFFHKCSGRQKFSEIRIFCSLAYRGIHLNLKRKENVREQPIQNVKLFIETEESILEKRVMHGWTSFLIITRFIMIQFVIVISLHVYTVVVSFIPFSFSSNSFILISTRILRDYYLFFKLSFRQKHSVIARISARKWNFGSKGTNISIPDCR